MDMTSVHSFLVICVDCTLSFHSTCVSFGFHLISAPFPSSGYPSEQYPYKPQGPLFISHPPDTVEFANTRGASIPCTAFGRPAPVLDWVNGTGAPIDSVDDLLQILPNNTLYFPPFRAEQFQPNVHQRTYRCTANNSEGKIISRNVTVRA
ncbi:hypothetical protein BaRGS_00029357, partial [Batillaria attramentaria]